MTLKEVSSRDRVYEWLRRLFDGATSDIPSSERRALRQGFVAYLDGALRSEVDEHEYWCHLCCVHEWAIRALLGGDPLLRSAVWRWVEKMVKEVSHDRTTQTYFSEGFFDDLVGDEEEWLTASQQPWERDGWRFVIDKVMRYLSCEETHWVTFEAFDEDVDRLHDTLLAYLEHPVSRGYDGPTDKLEISAALTRWRNSQD